MTSLLPWLYDHLEPVARGGGRLWAAFQAHEPICAAWAGTGGTTRVTTAIVDVDDPDPALGEFDVIYATNCLHVSRDVEAALAALRGLLRPGGTLVLGEGSHYSATTPSPLSLVLSLFDGWWDAPTSPTRPRAGFLQPGQWLAALREAGYWLPCAQTWSDGGREFGGVYTARA
jgi:SAM-dependent methyltransferase